MPDNGEIILHDNGMDYNSNKHTHSHNTRETSGGVRQQRDQIERSRTNEKHCDCEIRERWGWILGEQREIYAIKFTPNYYAPQKEEKMSEKVIISLSVGVGLVPQLNNATAECRCDISGWQMRMVGPYTRSRLSPPHIINIIVFVYLLIKSS